MERTHLPYADLAKERIMFGNLVATRLSHGPQVNVTVVFKGKHIRVEKL